MKHFTMEGKYQVEAIDFSSWVAILLRGELLGFAIHKRDWERIRMFKENSSPRQSLNRSIELP